MAANATALFGAEGLDASTPSALFISMPMIKTVLFAPRAILEANLRWQLIGALATVLVAAWLMEPSKRQRLATGVPVVGGNSKEDIMKSRNRFVHDAKSMVCDGYQQVRSFSFHWRHMI